MSIAVEAHWAAEGAEPERERRKATAERVVAFLLAPRSGPYGRTAPRRDRNSLPVPWEAPMSFAARPGRGGRQSRLPKGFETEATRELLAELGDPQIDTYKGSQLQIWELPGSDRGGVLAARLSTEDMQHGETAFGQVHGMRDMAGRLGLPVRYIVVATRTSGARSYEERLDFAFFTSLIEAGELPFLAFREPDRIARHTLPAERVYHELETLGVDLYLSALGRKVDWRADRLYLLASGMLSEQERQGLKGRTHGALKRRYMTTPPKPSDPQRSCLRRPSRRFSVCTARVPKRRWRSRSSSSGTISGSVWTPRGFAAMSRGRNRGAKCSAHSLRSSLAPRGSTISMIASAVVPPSQSPLAGR